MAKKQRRYEKTPFCKPCWELKYCPYGVLVETMPFGRTLEDEQKMKEAHPDINETQAEMFQRAKESLKNANYADDNDVWRNMFFVLYADPDKHAHIQRFDPADINCRIFGHACPVFAHGYLNVTETRERRRHGRHIPREIMLKVVRRDDYRCRSCGETVRDDEIEFDHVIPYAKGGPTTVENIRLLCRNCNRDKSDSIDELVDPDPSI